MNNDESTPKQWVSVHTFRHENIVVQINQLQAYRPRYSIEIARVNEDGKMLRHFGIFTSYEPGNSVRLRASIANTVASLIIEAENWIVEQTERREKTILEERESRGTHEEVVRPTKRIGKTERDRAKKKSQ